jgi:EAL domain
MPDSGQSLLFTLCFLHMAVNGPRDPILAPVVAAPHVPPSPRRPRLPRDTMSPSRVPEHEQSLDEVDPVIDLASRDIAGWEVLGRRDGAIAVDAIGMAFTTRRHVCSGRFVAVRLAARDAESAARQLEGAGRLDGLALILVGPIDRDGLRVLERARARGALVGCDSTAALAHFAALSPDLLSLRAPELGPARCGATAAGAVRVLVALAERIGARVLAEHVTSSPQAELLHRLGVALAQGEVFGRSPLRLAVTPANVRSAPFRRAKRSRTTTFEETRPSLPTTSSLAAVLDLCLDHVDHDWIVLVDRRSHPVRLLERAALLRGEPFEHQAVRVHPALPLRSVAQAALDRPEGHRSRPLVLCDCAGQYRGLLMIERTPKADAA